MPRIDAPTVAEHHAKRRAAVIAAARRALGSGGVAAVTPGAVAKAAGLARTSVYQYFPSTESLLTAAIEDMFTDAATRIARAVDGSTDPRQRIDAYITVALSAAAGQYGPFHAVGTAELPEGTRVRMRELHDRLASPLTGAIADLGAASPATATALVIGAIGAAITLVRRGADPAAVTAATRSFVASGLRTGGSGHAAG